MKTCPFCARVPFLELDLGVIKCSRCKISLPVDVWEGRLDNWHEVDGEVWYSADVGVMKKHGTLGSRHGLALRSDVEAIIGGEWQEATGAGYCMMAGRLFCHRYRIGSGKSTRTFMIQVRFEEELIEDDEEDCKVEAKPFADGFVARYLVSGEPVMYVASLRSDTEETM